MIIKAEITCGKCKREVRGSITTDRKNQIVDSDGFVLFENDAVCDVCLHDLPNN